LSILLNLPRLPPRLALRTAVPLLLILRIGFDTPVLQDAKALLDEPM
jgi:hypothetical protein